MKKILHSRTMLAILVFLLLLASLECLDALSKEWTRHRTQESTQAVEGSFAHLYGSVAPLLVLHRGDRFLVLHKVIRTEICHTVVSNYWVGIIPPQVAYGMPSKANWGDIGSMEYDEIYEVPKVLPNGTYHFLKKTTNFCGSYVYYTLNFDVEVTVAD